MLVELRLLLAFMVKFVLLLIEIILDDTDVVLEQLANSQSCQVVLQ